ncbi:putative divalent metal transporter [Cardiosporidium cionae]|uniref:Divalent metal transporter n=1 Tax=Cardiosporidium cionae TaxID=476202 RepID=A0ABQ7J468_9APIC|nr:putative divalent metal transporter [Cardiosporidium cionae]|eukprot:KAF8817902.1 putative divalent metal transporter [Cardiosporidium cionae]
MEFKPFPSQLEKESLLKDYESAPLPSVLFSECPLVGISPPDGIEASKFSRKFQSCQSREPEEKSSSEANVSHWYDLDTLDDHIEIPSPPPSPKLTAGISYDKDDGRSQIESETRPKIGNDVEPPVSRRRETSAFMTKFNRLKYMLYRFSFFIGPGWLVSMAYLDPGNLEGDLTVGNIRTVPGSGYQLLWLLLAAHIAGWSLQVLAVRLGNTTGMDLASLCRSEYNRPVAYVLWFFVEIAIIGADLQAVIGTAIALNLLLRIPLVLGIIITLLDTFIFMIIQVFGVRKLEFFFAFLVGVMAVCFWANLIISKPNVTYLLQGMFIPRIPRGKQLSALGLLGSIIMPHNLFLHSALVQSRKIKRSQVDRVQQANTFFSLETAIALIISFLINLAVVGSFANPNIVVPFGAAGLSLNNAAEALRNAFGSLAVVIWALGLLAAGQNATMAGTFAGQYLMQGIFKLQVNPVMRIVITRFITIIPLLLITILTRSSIDIVSQWVNILQSVLLPIALLPLLKFNFSTTTMGHMVVSKWWKGCYLLIAFTVIGGNLVLVFFTLLAIERSIFFWIGACVAIIAYVGILLFFAVRPIRGKYCCHAYQTLPQDLANL